MKDTYFVTGATGFVGANLVRRLIHDKKNVVILSRKKELNWRLADIASKIKIIEGDLLDKSLDKALKSINPTYIFHLAAYGSLPNEDNIDKLIDVNIKGTANLLHALEGIPYKLFINTGTSSEYGVKQKAMGENDPLVPINDYAVTKVAATLYCQKEAIRKRLPIITFRLFSAYGPYEEKTRLIPSIVLKAMEKKPLSVSSMEYVRDFIFIDDVVNAYMQATTMIWEQGEIINIGTGKQSKVGDVVRIISRYVNSNNPEIIQFPTQARQLEPRNWRASTKKSENILDWKALESLESGLEKTIKWFEKNKKLYE